MKKIFTMIGTTALILFSFYYTDSAVDIIKKNDPIMKEIIKISADDIYKDTSVDAVLINNSIIPGISGKEVDIDKSYSKMKKVGQFDESLLVFKEAIPVNSVSNNYDKYIISGNKIKNEVSLVFLMNNTSYIEEIIKLLNSKSITATFFLTDDIFDNSMDAVKILIANNQQVELYKEYSNSTIRRVNAGIKALDRSVKLKYCYLEQEDSNILKLCKSNNMHTIIPSIVPGNYLYNSVKNKIANGSIIKVENNTNTMRELSSTINYILQKGKKIVSLEKLLSE